MFKSALNRFKNAVLIGAVILLLVGATTVNVTGYDQIPPSARDIANVFFVLSFVALAMSILASERSWDIRKIRGFEHGIPDVLGFIGFLGVFIVVTVLVVYLGTIFAPAIWSLTGWDAMTIRWFGIDATLMFLIVAIVLWRNEYEKLVMLAFLGMVLSATTWLGAIGPWNVLTCLWANLESVTQGCPFTGWAFESALAFVMLEAGVTVILGMIGEPLYRRWHPDDEQQTAK